MNKLSKDKKDTFIKVRVSAEEKEKINKLAKSCNQKPSEYTRARLLGYQADNNKKLVLTLKARTLSRINLLAREVVKYQCNVDALLLLEALNTIEAQLEASK